MGGLPLPYTTTATATATATSSPSKLCTFFPFPGSSAHLHRLRILATISGLAAFVALPLFYYHGASSSSFFLSSEDVLHFSSPSFSHLSPSFHHPRFDLCSPSDLEACEDGRVKRLLKEWDNFLQRADDHGEAEEVELEGAMKVKLKVRPPYWQNCSERVAEYEALDRRGSDGSPPKWSLWKGNSLYPLPEAAANAGPPWVEGGDADNYPLTRQVQQDLWLHQHPANCSDSELRFMWVTWENGRGFGLGARIKCMLAFFAIAVRENRILIADSFSRADHSGCQGKMRNQWDCYFFPETTHECKMRALELRNSPEAWAKGIITDNRNYSWGEMWNGAISGKWGSPWEYMQPTAEVNGELMRHPASDRRWWRAQAICYMMRFPSEYTCHLMNHARHQYFGAIAARMMLSVFPTMWPIEDETMSNYTMGDMEKIVWASGRPWIPRPMISMHVRLGDKAKEMEMVPYKKYMELASRLRMSFPDATNIWLATEMEDVITESTNYTDWNVYYTNITRQTGETSMFDYEASIGVEASTNNGFVNFLMALESDFFIGPLGSTWSLLLDCMRATSGKLMSGFLSVNRDTFW